MTTRAAVNQVVQLGVEATHGTAVACSKLIEAFSWTFGDKPVSKQFTATGRKHPGASELLTEMSAGKIGGQGCYQSLMYPFSSVWGAPTTALVSPSTTAYASVWTPALSGPYSPKSLTLQNGDATDAEQYAYGLFSGVGYSFTREQEVQVSGDWFSQTFTDGVSLTATPTSIAQQPMVGAHFNVYLDTSSGGIGGTQITADVLKTDYAASGYYGQFWPVNRANASFTSHIDLMPAHVLKITFHASSAAVGFIATYLRTGARAYIRVDGQGALADVANNIHFEMKHDMCCFMTDVADLSDVDGVYGFETTWVVAEDTAWGSGQAQQMTLTNLLSAL